MKHFFYGAIFIMALIISSSCTSESPSNNVQQKSVQQIKDDQAVQLGEELYKEKISDIYFSDENKRKNLKWVSVGISIEKNRIVVFLEDVSSYAIIQFKKEVIDSPMIIFEEMHEVQDLSYIIVDSIGNFL